MKRQSKLSLHGNRPMRNKILEWVETWEGRDYADGIPDFADTNLEGFGKVPSYRRIVRAILKNDNCLVSLGYSRPNCEWYNTLKRIEIDARGDKNERI